MAEAVVRGGAVVLYNYVCLAPSSSSLRNPIATDALGQRVWNTIMYTRGERAHEHTGWALALGSATRERYYNPAARGRPTCPELFENIVMVYFRTHYRIYFPFSFPRSPCPTTVTELFVQDICFSVSFSRRPLPPPHSVSLYALVYIHYIHIYINTHTSHGGQFDFSTKTNIESNTNLISRRDSFYHKSTVNCVWQNQAFVYNMNPKGVVIFHLS